MESGRLARDMQSSGSPSVLYKWDVMWNYMEIKLMYYSLLINI